MNGRHVGVWRQIRGDRDQLVYDPAWLEDPQFRALSLSLPVTASRETTSPLVRNYFDNLLPDNPRIRERIRNRYRTRSTDAFDLLEAVGRDCVGAVQLMPEGRIPIGWDRIESKPLKTQDVAAILRAVPASDQLGADLEDDEGFCVSNCRRAGEDGAASHRQHLASPARRYAHNSHPEAPARHRRRRAAT